MKVRFFLFIISAVLLVSFASVDSTNAARAKWKSSGKGSVIQRIIRIEGTLEKPRVIFIVPRSRLWRGDFMDKSFINDILKPVRPDTLTIQ